MLASIPLRRLAAQPRRRAPSRTKRGLVFRYMYTNRLLLDPASPAGEALLPPRCCGRMAAEVEIGFNCYRGAGRMRKMQRLAPLPVTLNLFQGPAGRVPGGGGLDPETSSG